MQRVTMLALGLATCAVTSACSTDRVDVFSVDPSGVTTDAGVVPFDGGGLSETDSVDRQNDSRCDAPGLLACYSFDGNTAAAPNADLALSATTPTFGPGVFGEALNLASQTSATTEGTPFDLPRLSLDAWIAIDESITDMRYVAQRGSSWAARLERIAGVPVFSCLTTQGSSFAGPLYPGYWYHVACVFDGETVTAYLDGIRALPAATTLASAGDTPLRVGYSGFGGDVPMAGGIDELRIWSYALSSAEVQQAAQPPSR